MALRQQHGVRATSSTDTVMGSANSYTYGDMDQLTSSSNSSQTLNMSYDRWGNRTSQSCTGAGSCPSPGLTYNAATNHNTASVYDAAGNMTFDGVSARYNYDADGNVISVSIGGGTATTYSYDALNQRVRVDTPSSSTEFVFDQYGKRLAVLDTSHNVLSATKYWGALPVAFFKSGALHFEHQDWLGTERLRTTQSGSVEASFTSLPYGDQYSSSGTDADPYHFAQLDQDADSTGHATFRQYSSTQGRWMSMDPYYGSYDLGNPQSFNRYAYVLNNPLAYVDPLGLDQDDCDVDACAYAYYEDDNVYFIDVGGGGGGGSYGGGASGGGNGSNNQILPCLAKGVTVSAIGAVAVGAIAVGAVALGAPVAAVTAGLGVLAVAGGALLGYDVISNIRSSNWAGLAYNAGSVVGGAAVGGSGGRAIAEGINGIASPAWSWASDIAQRYNPNLGSVGQWLGTGPNPGSAGGSVAAAVLELPAQ